MKRRPDQNDKRANADARDETLASDADVEHFARAMPDVVRLAPDPRGRAEPPSNARRVRADPHIRAPRAATLSTSSSAGQDTDEEDEEEELDAGFVAPGVDRRELRTLRRGDHVSGDRLDLHGMTAAEAVASVKQFIESRRSRHRCVSIVHGRGLHSEGNVSILKTRVRACLRQHGSVLAYADAPRSDGGTGAVYVLLRKR